LSGGALVIAVLLLAGTLEVGHQINPRGLAILKDSRATAVASVNVGETARIGERDGAWVHVALDGSREGWVPVKSVLPLDALPADD
jgi:hypothetical protein